eukprot:10251-Heterococcus_DN1.PRE.2
MITSLGTRVDARKDDILVDGKRVSLRSKQETVWVACSAVLDELRLRCFVELVWYTKSRHHLYRAALLLLHTAAAVKLCTVVINRYLCIALCCAVQQGVITSTADERGRRTVVDLIPRLYQLYTLYYFECGVCTRRCDVLTRIRFGGIRNQHAKHSIIAQCECAVSSYR